jgi:uncharacterized membrane protein
MAVGLDVLLVLAGAGLLLVLIVLGDGVHLLLPARALLAFAYVLFVPGYALTRIALPRPGDLSRAERAALSVGLSIILIAVLAPIIDRLVGLRPWALQFVILGAVPGAILAASGRLNASGDTSVVPDPAVVAPVGPQAASGGRSWVARRSVPQLLGLALLTVLVGSAGSVVLTPASDPPTTAFYALGPGGFVGDYPYRVDVDEEIRVTFGVVSQEAGARTFRIEVRIPGTGEEAAPVAALRTASFTLQPGESREQAETWKMTTLGDDQDVHVVLLEEGLAAPYRQLKLVVDVGPAA